MRHVLFARKDELDLALRIANGLAGNIDINQGAVLSPADGFIGSGAGLQRFPKNLPLFVNPIWWDNDFVDRTSHGFRAGIPENRFCAFVPMDHLSIRGRDYDSVGSFSQEQVVEIGFHRFSP